VLCGIDQFPESRSIVLRDVFPGDFSEGLTPVILAVRVEIEGRVCVEAAGVWGPEAVSQGRWATEGSMMRRELQKRGSKEAVSTLSHVPGWAGGQIGGGW
jgi:hypothetical protein